MKRRHVAWTLCNFLVIVNLLFVSSVPAANTNSIASVNPSVNVNNIADPNTNNNSNNNSNNSNNLNASTNISSSNNTTNTATSPLVKEKTYEKCTGPGDPGPCKHYLYKWRFEPTTNECTTFIWGGCEGNSQNRFNTEAECLYRCIGAPHTLPPYLLQTTTKEPSTTEVAVVGGKSNTPPPRHYDDPSHIPVPFELRGPELTFAETGHEKTFFFAKNNTFIQMDGDIIQTFQLRLCREISFQFRTRLPHGLLVYHNVKNPDGIDLDPYALYVIVEKGQLKVVHVFGKHSTSVTVGEGLNRDEWHSVMVRIDVHGARLIARVDNSQEEVYLKGLNHDTNYGVSTNLPSVVLVGGLSSEEKLHGVKYIIESFVGCIRNVVLSSGKAASDLLPITPLVATKHENVNEGCSNKCHSRRNLCFVGSRCINHFYGISCDCFGTHYEGEHCDIYTATIMTLRGASYVSYRIYDWKDRVHSSSTRISMMFRTRHDDSALFYASGEALKHQYIAASLKNNSIQVEMDFGDNLMSVVLRDKLTRSYWHNLTIYHEQRTVMIILDQQIKTVEIPASASANLLFDPEIYFGGGPDLHKKKGLASHNNFVGILKYVFYNDVSILYELKKGNPKVHYHGILEAEFQENEVHVIPITYPFATSHIWWPINQAEEFNIKFDFRSSRTAAVLAYSDVTTSAGNGFWEIRLTADKLSFDLVPSDANSDTTLPTVIKINRPTSWHSVELDYRDGEIKFTVDYRHTLRMTYEMTFIIGDKVIIGSSLKSAASGLVGCIRDIEINGHLIEPRDVIKTERVVGEVAVDNCNYIDPCKRPNTCEHGGKCFVRDNQVTCDCKDTGYIGKNCHFTKYRKTCEELALLSYTKSDVYLIDIDGNGVFPPAHVKCDFQSLENATKTIVEHNLPSQIDVRSANDIDFSYNIRYREFSPEMLQELISHSLYCTQYIKYDCFRAPLELHSATWFISSSNNNTVDFLGNVKRGACPCSDNKTCVDPNQSCNCDVKENKWHSDEGYYNEPHSLGITNMFFRQQKDLDEEAQGRITLGPLECVETNTQKYVVTFTTSQSYIEVPGWRKGDIAFSFRTTGEKAILLFQPPIRPSYPSFVVALTGDYQLTFNFTLSTGESRTLVIDSVRKFNGGEWHKIWIDYNEYHVRFMINTDYKMVDLLPEQEFGPFEGSMFIGGATGDLLKKLIVKQGLIGCFRGLVVNGEILDIYSYMSVHLSEIIKDCKPSCVPSPCKNKAECKELWSTFQCVCSNPWAHLGEFCETNINEKALTFINRESFLKRNFLSTNTNASVEDKRHILKNILSQDILINLRTYDKHSLVLYANDHFNNFVHLFISEGKEIVFLYNYGDEIVNLTVVDGSISSLTSIQVAIIRSPQKTVMHVNERSVTVQKGTLLLDEYANKPWINPEKEVLSPHRPPAPPTEYFQFNIGGYDPANLLRTNTEFPELQGYIGCVRGLKIGSNLIDLAELNEGNIAQALEGVLPSCQLKCDAEPCKNGGFCKENFAKQESTCDCEHTSFLGEFCMEEKGADFSGESTLQRKFELTGKVDYVKLQLAFSSADLKRANRVMLLLQTNNERSYYLMVAIDTEGYLLFEEDREDGSAVGAHIERTFLKGARHSIYYQRNGTEASLLIDREQVPLAPIAIRPLMQNVIDSGANRVQIGGINTTDSRFAVFKSYSGCLSNIYIQVNNYIMKPLEEYMLFTKSGADNITVINFQGVRSAQCAAQFENITEPRPQEPILNFTMGSGQNWAEDPPVRVPYIAKHVDVSTKEEQTQVVFIILIAIFVVIVICCLLEVYRSHLEYKKRIERETDEDIIWSKEQATKMQQSPGNQTKNFNYKPVPQTERKASTGAPLVGILKNGTTGGQPKPTENTNGTVPREQDATTQPVVSKPDKIVEVDEEVEQEAKKPTPNETKTPTITPETTKDSKTDEKKPSADEKKEDKPKGPLIPGVRDSQLMDAELKWDPLPENSSEEPLLDGSLANSIAGDSDSDTNESPSTAGTASASTKTSQNPSKAHVKFDNQPSSARPRSRQVSWGPPPVAQDNVNQLPFKIDETTDDNDTEDDKNSAETETETVPNERRSQNALTTTNGHCSPTLDETPLLDPKTTDAKNAASTAPLFSASTEDLSTLDGSMSPQSQHQVQTPSDDPVEISTIAISPFVTKPNPKSNAAPVFIDESRRQFSNPISYIGGPRLEPRNRNSIESVLSLD